MNIKIASGYSLALLTSALFACSVAGDGDTDGLPEVPQHYEFGGPDGSSVSYSGQTFRHALVLGMKAHLSRLTARIDAGTLIPDTGDVVAELQFFYTFDSSTSGELEIGIQTTPPPAQIRWDDLSSGKDLAAKIAGNDPTGQHKDWSVDFLGWPGATSPDALVRSWFEAVETLAINRATGMPALDPAGAPIDRVFVSAAGLDYQQLLQKFLVGAVAFSQATDDYLDDDLADKGLNASNALSDDDPFTALEHHWDEAFGYFGAARDYLDYTDDEIAAAGGRADYALGYHDTSKDGSIDLLAEYNFGHALNAGKRDRGSDPSAPTDFSQDAMSAFLTGRAIIANAAAQGDGALNDSEWSALVDQRDRAVTAWEGAIAASVVHYANAVLRDADTIGTPEYSFVDHAKHWSELKGFALGLQFNPRSPLNTTDFVTLHALIGDAPVLPGHAGLEQRSTDLVAAKVLLGERYGFAAANVGSDDGTSGW